jgi:pyruvate kinase
VGEVPPVEQAYKLAVGDKLIITARNQPYQPTFVPASDGAEPAQIGCTLPEAIRDAKVGERIFFDDGKLEGVINEADREQLTVEIVSARKGVAKLKGSKGINFPDTQLDLPSLTEKDLNDLDFVAQHADMVSLSFVRCSEDVEQLIAQLDRRNATHLGVVLKIETQRAVADLPKLLLTALRSPPVGVMIARGDLGVELGFTRLAEIQEEILWLCEAAHVPVIWATQVLENLAKKGLPARGEVTDAAMAVQAECVMLNKGRHIVETVEFLEDVLQRMQDHHEKKQALLRKLSIAEDLSGNH